MEALEAGHRDQLKAWFAAQRRRREDTSATVLEFALETSDVFREGETKGGALGVDFVEATKPETLVDVGPVPSGGFRGGLRRSQLLVEQRMKARGIGAVVWNCGRSACRLLPRLPECRGGKFRRGLRVLEVGCGTGIVGMACWLRGADVTMTDKADVLELTRSNVARNLGTAEPVGLVVTEHAWGSGTRLLGPPFDVVVGSDCLYDVAALPGLRATLLASTDGDSVVYLAYKRRLDDRERPFFEDLRVHFAEVRFSAAAETPREWRGGTGLHVCRLAGRRASCSEMYN